MFFLCFLFSTLLFITFFLSCPPPTLFTSSFDICSHSFFFYHPCSFIASSSPFFFSLSIIHSPLPTIFFLQLSTLYPSDTLHQKLMKWSFLFPETRINTLPYPIGRPMLVLYPQKNYACSLYFQTLLFSPQIAASTVFLVTRCPQHSIAGLCLSYFERTLNT